MENKYIFIVGVLCFCLNLPVNAGMYKWYDEEGKVHYTNKRPPANAKRANINTGTFSAVETNKAPSIPKSVTQDQTQGWPPPVKVWKPDYDDNVWPSSPDKSKTRSAYEYNKKRRQWSKEIVKKQEAFDKRNARQNKQHEEVSTKRSPPIERQTRQLIDKEENYRLLMK